MSERRIEEEIDELEALLQPGREEDLRTFLLLLHPADVADLIAETDESTSIAVLTHLDDDRAADLLSELERVDQARILGLTKPQQFARIVSEMESDDIADLLQGLQGEVAKDLLSRLPIEEREDVTELLGYDPESAGGIMKTELVSVTVKATVADAIEAVRKEREELDDIHGVFVVDDKKRYLGSIPLQELIFAPADEILENVLDPQCVTVTTDVDQEEVARTFDHYNLDEVAVVDQVDRLRGRITADDIFDVLVEEAEEDTLLMAGAGDEAEVVYSGDVLKVAGRRLPWLFATFFGGLSATYILDSYSVVFGTVVVLLTFVPVITGMSGNVGTQSAMIMIQGLAAGHIPEDEIREAIFRDLMVGAVIALTCGVLVTLIVALWKSQPMLGLCVGIALMASMLTASLLGSVEPIVLKRFGIDPAIATGPLITSINDITGVAIYAFVSGQFLVYLKPA